MGNLQIDSYFLNFLYDILPFCVIKTIEFYLNSSFLFKMFNFINDSVIIKMHLAGLTHYFHTLFQAFAGGTTKPDSCANVLLYITLYFLHNSSFEA